MTPTLTGQKIADIASSYLGKREIPNNMGFTDRQFEKKMVDVGFVKGMAWCALFLELSVAEASPGFYAKYKQSFSASATTTFKNFDILGKTSKTPTVGAGVIWRHGSGWQGHAAVVIAVNDDGTITTVEGNTNAAGGREGIEVAQKIRKLKVPYTATGLNLVGFINFEL